NNRGQLYSSVLNDTRYASALIAQCAEAIAVVAVAAAYCLVMVYLSWQLAATILPTFLVLGLLFQRRNRRSAAAGKRLSESYGGVATAINEALNGFAVIKTRAVIEAATARIDREAARMADAAVSYERVRAFLDSAPQPLLMAVALAVFYFAI